MMESPNQISSENNYSIFQGIANEVLGAIVATIMIFSYFIYTVVHFFKVMPPGSSLLGNVRSVLNFFNNIENLQGHHINPPNEGHQDDYQNEFITMNNCSICLNQIQYEITTSCSHLFCAKCIISYWNSIHKYRLSCPMCRSHITMLHFNFEEPQVKNPQIKPIINEIYHYNFLYSNERKSIWVKIRETPFYVRRIISFLSTREGLRFLLFSVSNSVFLIVLILYILSPLDLIPEAIFGLIGFLDDLVAMAILIYFLADLYYQYMMRRNMMRYHPN